MSTYNLSDNVNESFEFEVAGKRFSMRYPLTEELDKIQDIYRKVAELDPNSTDEIVKAERKDLSEQVEKLLNSFIEPVGHEEDIDAVMKTQNVRVLKNFNKMISSELAIS